MEISNKQRKNAWIGFALGLIVAAVVVIVLIATTGNANNTQNDNGTSNKSDQETEVTNSGDSITAKNMKPYASGPFVYTFEDLRWVFEDITDGQKVKVWFEKFSRKRQSNTYVNFREPYKLGTYSGTCNELSSLNLEKNILESRPVGFAECVTNQGKGTQFVVTQNENVIKFRVRTITAGKAVGKFNTIYTLDMTNMVR